MYALRLGILKYILYFIISHFDVGHKFKCNVFVVFFGDGDFCSIIYLHILKVEYMWNQDQSITKISRRIKIG
jgi:hypothetical protein